MSQTRQRRTAEELVAAFNRMDIESIIAVRSPDCLRYIYPASLGHKPTDNDQYRTSLVSLKQIFHNFSLIINDTVEDRDARKIVMYLSARADSLAGEYINEYMWTLEFDESGEKITRSTEFVDAVVNVEFWPKLREAMKLHQSKVANGAAP